jgi:tetraacyldisaccharide 4'-kinase
MNWSPLLENTVVNKALAPLGFVYGLGAYGRILGYNSRLLKSQKVEAVVISVGNLTLGGTGKTPVVIDLARRFIAQGYSTGILSRGYGRTSRAPYIVASRGNGLLPSVKVEDIGDEPFLIGLTVPEVKLVIGANRRQTARLAVEELGCQVLLLDDGFQHLPLSRNLDVVLFDINDDPRKLTVFPQGRLREPLTSLARADALVFTKVTEGDDARLATYSQYLNRFNKTCSVASMGLEPSSLVGLCAEGASLELSALKGLKVGAFCAIARPEGFFEAIKASGATIVEELAMRDHHWFSSSELLNFQKAAAKNQADLLLCTMKDLVRLFRLNEDLDESFKSRCYALDVSCRWHKPLIITGLAQ